MSLVPDGSTDNEVGLASDNGELIAIMNVAETTAATPSRSATDGEKSEDETREMVGEVTEAVFADQKLEVIGGYRVHRLASRFPLIVGKEFDDLVEAAARAGRLQAVELHDGLLIDGRNRVRVQEELRSRSIEIDLPVVAWEPSGEATVEEHIWSVNANRRHLTDDQRATLALEFLPLIRAARQARQDASRFGRNGADAAAVISPLPNGQADKPHRTSAEKDAASTAGCLAALANVSNYRAGLAVALLKAVDAGEADESEINAVVTGAKRLRDAGPRRKAGGRNKPKPQKQDKWDDEVLILEANPIVCEAEVRRRWEEQKAEFAIADHRELRRLFMQVICEEQGQFGR